MLPLGGHSASSGEPRLEGGGSHESAGASCARHPMTTPADRTGGSQREVDRHLGGTYEPLRRQIHCICGPCGRHASALPAPAGPPTSRVRRSMPSRNATSWICGVDTGIPGFAFQDSAGKWQGLDIAYCQRHRRRGARRSREGEVRRHHGQGPLLRAAIGRDRRADPRFDPHAHAQHRSRPRHRRGQLLHRPGLHGEEEPERRPCEGAGRRHHLRDHRHHARAQHRRLQPRQQHQDQYAAVRQVRGGLRRGRGRALRRLYR